MKLSDIKNVLVLGAGTMGLRIGLQAALSGFNVTIYDVSEKSLSSALKMQAGILQHLQNSGKISEDEAKRAVGNIGFTMDAEEAARDADLVSESVYEDPAVKKEVWSKFGKLCPAKTVFTTNTSYMLPSWFANESGRPERFCAFHFHDVFDAIVVDVMPHGKTEPWVVELLMELGPVLKQVPVFVAKESPGYLFNSMLVALIGAAGNLVTSGVGSFEDVDKSWYYNFHTDGPFKVLDHIGLDTAWHVTNSLPDAKSKKFADLLKTYVDSGKLGVKTKQGFYTY